MNILVYVVFSFVFCGAYGSSASFRDDDLEAAIEASKITFKADQAKFSKERLLLIKEQDEEFERRKGEDMERIAKKRKDDFQLKLQTLVLQTITNRPRLVFMEQQQSVSLPKKVEVATVRSARLARFENKSEQSQQRVAVASTVSSGNKYTNGLGIFPWLRLGMFNKSLFNVLKVEENNQEHKQECPWWFLQKSFGQEQLEINQDEETVMHQRRIEALDTQQSSLNFHW